MKAAPRPKKSPSTRRKGCLLAAGVVALVLATGAGALLGDLWRATTVEGVAASPVEPLGEVSSLEPPAEPPPAPAADAGPPVPPPAQAEEYAAARPKTVLELQQYRTTGSIAVEDGAGTPGQATLVNLQPRVNRWFLLRLDWSGGRAPAEYHLENLHPRRQGVELDPRYLHGLLLETPDGRWVCDLWSSAGRGLAAAAARGAPFTPLCEGMLLLRGRVQGRKTAMEWTTDLLRDNVWEGEKITVFVRQSVYQDAFRVSSDLLRVGDPAVAAERDRPPGTPLPPLTDPAAAGRYVDPVGLGLQLEAEEPGRLLVGRWYAVKGIEGAFVSAFQAALAAPEVVAAQRGLVNPLDEIEASALVYLVAFDLGRFQVGFAMGTDHPRVDWSERVPQAARSAALPGPDGIGTVAPLVMTGMLPRHLRERAVAAFTGGFKRSHGAFRSGELALVNGGSHYGFVEAGAVLSKLRPGLATFVADVDGEVDLRTWTAADDAELHRIASARQNGVPILEPDPATGEPRVGRLVPQWAVGNWSGSVDQRLRTLRAGLCLQEEGEHRFLIYGYFSTATPSGMARVFQAYRCDYAMLSDMNALEHTYLALYRRTDADLRVDHLIDEMRVLDKEEAGAVARRFLDFPDNRDFFYVMERSTP